MSDLPVPEPTERDEELALEFIRTKDDTDLRGTPDDEQRCDACHFYHDRDQEISYCWHDDLEILVGGSWVCDRWQPIGAPSEQESAEEAQRATTLHAEKVEAQQWIDQPKLGEQCNACLYYLDPEASVSYCWHPRLQVGVAADNWCQWWEAIPGQA